MNRIPHLEDHFAEGRTLLHAFNGLARLARPGESIRAPESDVILTIDLKKEYDKLQVMIGRQSSWSLRQLSILAGVSHDLLLNFQKAGALDVAAGSGRGRRDGKYGFDDMYSVGVLSSLRRHGANYASLASAYCLLKGRKIPAASAEHPETAITAT